MAYSKQMEGSPHKHKRTIAQDFLTKSLSQSIELNLSLTRYSISSDHPGPLTLRVTHLAAPQEHPTPPIDMKKSSIQERPNNRAISNLRSNLMQLEEKLSQAQRQLNAHNRPSSPSPERLSPPSQRSTVGGGPLGFQRMLGLFVCNEVSEDESTINLESQKMLGMKSRDKLALLGQQSTRYYTGHLLKALVGSTSEKNQVAITHLCLGMSAMKKAMILRVPSQVETQSRKITLRSAPQLGKKTLLLELEQTLLVIRKEKGDEDDLAIGSGKGKFFVSLRPYLFSFLKKTKQYFQLVVFTTLERETAGLILEEIDPERKLLADCLSREHCLPMKGDLLCKDIRIVNRSSKEMCLVDCSSDAALLHPENCIPILPYHEGERKGQDRELMELERFLLKQVLPARDIRQVLRERFKMNRYWQYQSWESLVRELYLD